MKTDKFTKITPYKWQMPKEEGMNAPGLFFGSEEIVEKVIEDEKVLEQVKNVANLPGIQKASMAMPDAHRGYGFPIGGVAAFDPDQNGVISVGGVGFDISCGVRAIKTGLTEGQVRENLEELAQKLYEAIPAGVGSTGEIKLSINQMNEVLEKGAEWAVEEGYGTEEDLKYLEEDGCMEGADSSKVSKKAKERQLEEMGTLGAGNHYLEVQKIEKIYDEEAAEAFGLKEGEVTVLIHCGSRGLGHQVATDYLDKMPQAAKKHGISIPDKQLASAPINSKEGQEYLKAMYSAANLSMANRQIISGLARDVFNQVLPESDLKTVYEINHNTCKKEKHQVDGEEKELYVHRKGATRSFGPGSEILPEDYKKIGQPVIIGGTMGTASYILRGTEEAHEESFASTCHGAGRVMSRNEAKDKFWGQDVVDEMKEKKGIVIKANSMPVAAEEAPGAYKDINKVAESVEEAGLSERVAKLKPMAVIKG